MYLSCCISIISNDKILLVIVAYLEGFSFKSMPANLRSDNGSHVGTIKTVIFGVVGPPHICLDIQSILFKTIK